MARRATYFFDVHTSQAPRLLVSGGWEFMNPDGATPDPRILESLIQAYRLLGYDIGLAGQAEAETLAHLGIEPEPVRQTAENTPFTVIETASGDRIGFIRFPSLPQGRDIPPQRVIEEISRLIKQERNSVRLLVALSDWGWVGEREYLAQKPDFVPDILLGSGRGSGVNGRIEADGRCLWVRPYDKGQTVSQIQVQSWPERTASFKWSEPGTIMPTTVGLGDQYEDNPDVGAILQ